MDSNGKDSAQLEREVEQQRQRIENRIGEIRDRLSPGQLVDEVLSYTKNGGQQFTSNLGQQISSNPLPAALLGISVAWLMSGKSPQLGGQSGHAGHSGNGTSYNRAPQRETEYPYATVSGGMRRVNHAADDSGDWYAEFADTAGKRYKAKTNEAGHRVSHFVDDTGKKIGGFIDEAGHRVKDFQDEAGNRLEDAAGWASHTWHDLQHNVGETIDHVGQQAQQLGSTAQAQMDRTSRMIAEQYRNQPLVGGALAFAVGAALAAALPHTRQEDEAVGKIADKVRTKAGEMAGEAYEDGKARAADLYEKGKEGAASAYEKVAEPGDKPAESKPGAFH